MLLEKLRFTGRELHFRVTTDGRDTFITLMEARIFEERNGKCKECNFKEYELTLNSQFRILQFCISQIFNIKLCNSVIISATRKKRNVELPLCLSAPVQ